MTPEATQVLDEAILKTLEVNNTQFGMERSAIRFHVRQFGGGTPPEEILLERVEYLAGKGMVLEVSKTMHKTIRAWKITAVGLHYLDIHNL